MNQKERLLRPTQLIQRLSVHFSALCLLAVLCAGTASASPFEEVKPGDHLYQRVKALEKWGLLDASDQAVLDRGEAVTRLQLAFYTEKAKTRIAAPMFSTTTSTAVSAPALIVPVQNTPEAVPALVAPSQSVPQEVVPQPTAVMVPPSVSKEIDDLLKAMKSESTYLRARQPLLDADIKAQEVELQEIKRIQTDAEGVVRKANKNSGDWSFNTNADWHFEDISVKGNNTNAVLSGPSGVQQVTGVSSQRVTREDQDFYFGAWGSLGKASLSTGFTAQVFSTNDASTNPSAAVSLKPGVPQLKMNLDGRFGTWNFFGMREGYDPDTSMGDFTRAQSTNRPKLYISPYNIVCWSPDKFDKNWDDYMHNLGFVPTQALLGGIGQTGADRVFDGMIADGSDMPHLGPTKIKLLAGHYGTDASPTWFEFGTLVQRPWLNDHITTKVAGYWLEDTNIKPLVGSIDLQNYTGEVQVDLKPIPVIFSGQFAHSSLYTGVDNTTQYVVTENGSAVTIQGPVQALPGQAVQLQASCYPFNIFYQNIGAGYSNFQSKVDITGIDFTRYGLSSKQTDDLINKYGEVGEADTLQSNRHGVRLNLGWNGRKEEWMQKSLPKFLDYFLLNVDAASRKEFVSINSADMGNHYVLEPWNFVAPYYPEDEGIWGLDLYGGYAGTQYPVRQNIDTNITSTRQAEDPLAASRTWSSTYEWVRYRFQMSSERIPLLDPVTGADISDVKTYNYLALSNKWQLNRFYGSSKPLYLAVFYGNDVVSGSASGPYTADVSCLLHQSVIDTTLMAGRLLPYVQVSVHFAEEKWHCDYSIPRIEYDTKSTGAGLDYNIPWGSAKLGLRYNHVVFKSEYVPANDYVADQIWAQGNFRF